MGVAAQLFNVETVHDTVNRTMTQKLDPFKLFVDWNNSIIKVYKNEELVKSVDFSERPFSISDYERLLNEVEERARFSNNGQYDRQ